LKIQIVISDTHVGSYMGLCPPDGIRLDNGAMMTPNKYQRFLWECWQDLWENWVPKTCKGAKKKILVHNGDAIQGTELRQVDAVPSEQSQKAAFVEIMKPIIKKFDDFYMVRGTEAHGRTGEQSTEELAQALKTTPEEPTGNHSRSELWLEDKENDVITNYSHHIGFTNSAAYESSAPMRELISAEIEAAQWGARLPQVIVRSHRHRYTKVVIPTNRKSDITCVITPSWQLKTVWSYKADRLRMPHIGAIAIITENGEWEIKRKLYMTPRPMTVEI